MHIPHTIQVWGIASFIYFGYSRASYLIDEINSTLSFFVYPAIGVVAEQIIYYMSSVTKILEERALSVINTLESHFSSRDFIWGFMTAYEEEYVELIVERFQQSEEGHKGIIKELHQQIGKYLSNNAAQLAIEKDLELGKEESISPFGKVSSTQCWRKL